MKEFIVCVFVTVVMCLITYWETKDYYEVRIKDVEDYKDHYHQLYNNQIDKFIDVKTELDRLKIEYNCLNNHCEGLNESWIKVTEENIELKTQLRLERFKQVSDYYKRNKEVK